MILDFSEYKFKSNMNKETKYQAIKLKSLNHWLWFKTDNVKRENGRFIGVGGWGKGGEFTEISINESDIEGEISSDSPQY